MERISVRRLESFVQKRRPVNGCFLSEHRFTGLALRTDTLCKGLTADDEIRRRFAEQISLSVGHPQ